MNFDQLKIFLTVVECGSFTKAAEALYISHSTTSRSVAALEETLGVRLLVRDSRSLRLSCAGQTLFSGGEALIEKARELEEAVKNADQGQNGSISLVSVNLASRKLNACYKNFCSHYPEAKLGIFSRELSEIVGQVASGKADIGVSFSYALPENMDEFQVEVIETERFCIIAPPSSAFSGRKSISTTELRALNYVSLGEQRSKFSKKLEEPILEGRGKGEIFPVQSLESLFLQVQNGRGVSLVPRPMSKEYGGGCTVLELEDFDSSFNLVIFWSKKNENSALSLFTELLK